MSPKKKKPRVSVKDYRLNTKPQHIDVNVLSGITSSSSNTSNISHNILPKDQGLDFKSFREKSFTEFQWNNLIIRTITQSMLSMKKKIYFYDINLPNTTITRTSKRIKIEESYKSQTPTNYMTTYNPFNDKNRLFLEDVMSLDTNTHILLLIPKKLVDNDINLTKIKDFLSPYTTQLSSKSPKLYYLFPASTVSCNKLSNNSEIDSIQDLSTKGYTIMLESYTSKLKHEHFISWEDILMGKDTGIQVWSEVTELRDCKVNFFNNTSFASQCTEKMPISRS